MFLSHNKTNNVYPCKLQFYSIKVGFKGVKLIQACFRVKGVKTILACLMLYKHAFALKQNKMK